MSILDDAGSLSGEFLAIEEPDSHGHRQSLWVRVGPVWHGNEQDREPGIWICYQEEHMGSALAGPVLLTPATWRQLDKAVRRRLRRQARRKRKR